MVSNAVVYTPAINNDSQDTKVVTEGLDIQYVGIENISLYASAEWSQVDSNVAQSVLNLTSSPTTTLYMYDDGVDNDKFMIGANWYPLSGLSVSVQGSHRDRFDDPNIAPSTTNKSYTDYLLMQDLSQDNANFRVTWRPLSNLTLVTRYDFDRTNISNHVQTAGTTSGTYLLTGSEDSADITTHILSESVTWSPISKMYIQGSAHLIWSLTNTPANNYSVVNGVPEVVDFRNNYWDGSLAAGYAIDDKTDVQVAYTCFFAINPNTSSPTYMGYAANTGEQSLTIGLTRKFSPNLVWNIKYGYFQNRDTTSGGLYDYDAQALTTTLKYRF